MNITSQLGKRKGPVNSPETSPVVGKDGGGRATSRPRKALVMGDPVESKIKSLEEARAFFVEQGQLNEGAAANTTSILNLLFWLAVGPNKSAQFLTDGIRSAYQVLKHAQETGTIGDTHEGDPRVLQELESQRASLANLEHLVTKIASDNQGEMKEIRKDIEETKKGITEIKTNTTETLSSTAPNWALPRSHRSQGLTAPSYASVTSKDLAQQHVSAIARGNDRERQIIITFRNEATKKDLAKLSPTELVAKGGLALELMAKGGIQVPKGAAFVQASITKSGAVIYQINSKGVADWLRMKDNLDNFTRHMGDANTAQARLFHVLVKFVAVQFTPENQLSRNIVESNNHLPSDAIAHAKWIKAPERRKIGQKTAHVIMGFNTRELANQAIDTGLIIENKRSQVEKLLIEPSRCFNCQGVKGDHRAAECPVNEPVCARCSGNHRTMACEHMGTPRCVNCQADGHSASDRDCPSFERSTEHYRRYTPDAKYRYFPIEMDTRTWEPQDFPATLTQPAATEPAPPNWADELEHLPSPSPMYPQAQTSAARPMTPRPGAPSQETTDMEIDLMAPPKPGSPQAIALSTIQSTLNAWIRSYKQSDDPTSSNPVPS
jgi:hypothetical protein